MKHAGRGAGDVVVADEGERLHSAVGRPALPVVDHVVADIEPAGKLAAAAQAPGEAPVAARAVGQQIVMEAANVARDAAGKRVPLAGLILPVVGDVERLGDEAALHRDVFSAPRAYPLVDRPAHRTVVDDGVIAARQAGAILGVARFISHPDPHVPDHHIVRAETAEGVAAHADAVARRGLAGDGDEGIADNQFALEGNRAADAKHDRPRPLRLDRLTERSRPGIVERGDGDHPAASTAGRELSVAFGRRKRRHPQSESPHRAGGDAAAGVHRIDPPIPVEIRLLPFPSRRERGPDGRHRMLRRATEVQGRPGRCGLHGRLVGAEIDVELPRPGRWLPAEQGSLRGMPVVVGRLGPSSLQPGIRHVDRAAVEIQVLVSQGFGVGCRRAGLSIGSDGIPDHDGLAGNGFERRKHDRRFVIMFHAVRRLDALGDCPAVDRHVESRRRLCRPGGMPRRHRVPPRSQAVDHQLDGGRRPTRLGAHAVRRERGSEVETPGPPARDELRGVA